MIRFGEDKVLIYYKFSSLSALQVWGSGDQGDWLNIHEYIKSS